MKTLTILPGHWMLSARKTGFWMEVSENQAIRFELQLTKVGDGYHLWSEKYDRELKDIFDIQDEISLAILKEIKVKLFGENKQPSNDIPIIPKRINFPYYLNTKI